MQVETSTAHTLSAYVSETQNIAEVNKAWARRAAQRSRTQGQRSVLVRGQSSGHVRGKSSSTAKRHVLRRTSRT